MNERNAPDDTPYSSFPIEHSSFSGDAPPQPERPLRRTISDAVRAFVETIIFPIIFALLIIHFVGQASVVHGQSMEPNLHTDQRLIIEKISYRFYSPERGEIVVLNVDDSDLPLIKRVVGLPGETIQIQNNQVFINGRLLDEPYLPATPQQSYGPIEIPSDHLFVMGDNRLHSRDSRSFGPVPINQIVGRAWLSIWPPEDIGLIE